MVTSVKQGRSSERLGSQLSDSLRAFRSYPVVSDTDEFQRLYQLYKHGKTAKIRKDAQLRIIYGNVRLVIQTVREYQGRGLDVADLVQEGITMLEPVLERFDPARGAKFSTYAVWWIRARIARAINEQTAKHPFRIPQHVRTRMNKVRRANRKFFAEHRRDPTAEELLAPNYLGKDVSFGKEDFLEQVKHVLFLLQQTSISFDTPKFGGDEEDQQTAPMHHLALAEVSAESRYAHKQLQRRLAKAIDTLAPRPAQILRHRFGLDGYHEMTLEEIGEAVGLTRERIRQIESKALKDLARHLGSSAHELLGPDS